MGDRCIEMRAALPASYVAFIEKRGGWAGDLGDRIGYVDLWNRETIQECYMDLEMALNLTNRWFPFGSNGGGEMLCFDLASGTDQVSWIPYIGMEDDAAMLQPFSFAEIAAGILNTAEPG